MKKFCSTLLFLFLVIVVFGQEFKGILKDQETNKIIPFAHIYLADMETGLITDTNGVFTLEKYPNKKTSIQISHIGYKTKVFEFDFSEVIEMTFFLEPSHLMLQEVVLSVPVGKLQNENIISVDRRDIKDLIQTSPVTLAEAISTMPGVEQRTTGAGIGKPIIRGLSGNRIVTYAQGMRIENQQWGDEHGLGIGEVGIESVEVIKGPASLLYGSDALGGVLYFVDERYAKENCAEGFIKTNFQTNALGTSNNLGYKINKKGLKWNVFGTYVSNADYQIPNGERVYNSRFKESSFKTSLGYLKNNWISNFRYSLLLDNFGIIEEDSIYSSSQDRVATLPFQTINNHNLSWENTFFTGNSKFNLVLGCTGNRRKEFEDNATEAALDMNLQSYTYNLKWYSPTVKEKLKVIIGSQGMYQTHINKGEELLIPDANMADVGVFSILNYDLKKIKIQGGVRTDFRIINAKEESSDLVILFPELNRTFKSFNYSIGAIYPLKKINFRANLSSGFRAPNTSELLSNGIHEGTNQYVKGSSTLKSENATQIDFTFNYKSKHLVFSANTFYDDIRNYIYLSPTAAIINNTPVYEYLQIGAILYGGETGIHYHPHKAHWLHLESNLSTVYAKDKNNDALPLIPATRLNSTLKAEISQKGKIQFKNIFINHIYKFDQNRIGQFETITPNYQLLNAGVNIELKTKNLPIEVIAGVKNILNTKYIDHLSRLKPMSISNQGINYYISLKLRFEKRMK